MTCTINEIQLSFDKANKVKNTISRVANTNVEKETMLAAWCFTDEFANFVKENINNTPGEGDVVKGTPIDFDNFSPKELTKINANRLYSLFDRFYKANYRAVENFRTKKGNGRLNGFSSVSAKRTAKSYVAYLIKNIYQEELLKPENVRKKPKAIIADVNDAILNGTDDVQGFYDRANDYAREVLASKEYSKEDKAAAKLYIDAVKQVAELDKATDEYKNELIKNNTEINSKKAMFKELGEQLNIAKQNKDDVTRRRINLQMRDNAARIDALNKRNKELEEIIKAKAAEFDNVRITKLLAAEDLILDHAPKNNYKYKTALINYANLVLQSRSNTDEWYFQVFNTKEMTSIIKDFTKEGDLQEYLEELEADGDIGNKFNGESYDGTTKSWEDSMYKTVNQAVSARIRLVLSTIPKLNSPYIDYEDGDTSKRGQDLYQNNELMVTEYLDAQYLITQIFSNVQNKCHSRNAFLNQLDKISKTVPDLYGLGAVVAQMKHNPVFLNEMFAAFAKPLIKKTMITIEEISAADGIKFDFSNPNSDKFTGMFYKMSNKIKSTYYTYYDSADFANLNKIDNTDVEKSIQALNLIFTKYFPAVDNKAIANYINQSANKAEAIDNVRSELANLLTEIRTLKTKIRNTEIRNENEYNAARKEWNKNKQGEKPTRKYVNVSDFNITTGMNKAMINLSRMLMNYSDSKVRLNSANAEGNNSSDITKNCYATRIIEQLHAEDEDNPNGGANYLKDYFTQGMENGGKNQYYYNPLLFGLRDIDENVITDDDAADGLFYKDSTGWKVNPFAKKLLDINLFNGTKNIHNREGAGYAKMTKLDFFISQYFAYEQSTPDQTEEGVTYDVNKQRTANYPMRIGSDAPKIYFIKSHKYNYRQCQLAFYNHVMNEINIMTKGLNALFKSEPDGRLYLVNNKHNLIDRLLYNGEIIDEEGHLTGNAFKFQRLFDVGQFDAAEQLRQILPLYGQGGIVKTDENGRYYLDLSNEANPFKYNAATDQVEFLPDRNQKIAIVDIVNDWMNAFNTESAKRIEAFTKVMDKKGVKYNLNDMQLFLLNAAQMNMAYDDLFEGDYKLYKGARDFLKRTKEVQAGGDAYAAYDMTEAFGTNLKELELNGKTEIIPLQTFNDKGSLINYSAPSALHNFKDAPLSARNGFRAITIYNTKKVVDKVDEMQKELERLYIESGLPQKVAHKMSVDMAAGFGFAGGPGTKINDAQSYITLEEFIRRVYADGTYPQYQKLIDQLIDLNIPAEQIDISEVNSLIQVRKNFYYDKVYDDNTGLYYSRQIKNAEFVLIPKLLPKNSELRTVYDWMRKNDIGQVNTAETSKAGNKNIYTIWDAKTGKMSEEFLKNANEVGITEDYITNYEYKYLYKQQEVPHHIGDTKNKAAIQIMKKIIDNVYNEIEKDEVDENGNLTERAKKRQDIINYANNFQEAFAANIKEDFYNFLDMIGWTYDANTGKISNKNPEIYGETLDFSDFYARAREEAARLGMDSNFMEYLIPNPINGVPDMPSWMNTVSTKLESIAQAMFNKSVTRQVLPGWHAAQITQVGYSDELEFDPISGEMQVYLPRWSPLIPKGATPEEDAQILKQIQEEGLDIHIGYRIPTEGKQSIAVLKVVGFVNEALGSTIVVPNAWVTQTGSDFDVDSVYGINWEMYTTKTKEGKIAVHKVPYTEDTVDFESLYINYVKQHIDNQLTRPNIREAIKENTRQLKEKLIDSKNTRDDIRKLIDEKENDRNELFNDLPQAAKNIIIDYNAQDNVARTSEGKIDIRVAYPDITKLITDKVLSQELTEEERTITERYIDDMQIVIAQLAIKDNTDYYGIDQFYDEKNASTQQIIAMLKEDNLRQHEDAAKELGLLSFEEWQELPFLEKLDRKGRNNVILDNMIKIMQSDNSREEQFGRSQFEDVVNANKLINDLYRPETSDGNKKVVEQSPYNPLDQIDYFNDVMGGARLKALSVNWDTFASKVNRLRAFLSDKDVIQVIINTTGLSAKESKIAYDKVMLETSYGEDVQEYSINEPVKLKKYRSKPLGEKVTTFKLFTGTQLNDNFTDGSDAMWANIAREYGLEQVIGYGPKEYDTREDKEYIEERYVQCCYDLGRPIKGINEKGGKLVRRDFMQIENAKQVFAVGDIIHSGEIGKDYPNRTKHDVIDGGTGYGVQYAITLKKEVHVFNQYDNLWYEWSYKENKFIPTTTPMIKGDFAAIGTRKITDGGIEAIRNIFENSINGVSLSEVKSTDKQIRLTLKYDHQNEQFIYTNIYKSRLSTLLPYIKNLTTDTTIILHNYYDLLNKSNRNTIDEINDFIDTEIEEQKFTKGYVPVTKALLDLMHRTTNEEFISILNNYEEIIEYFEKGESSLYKTLNNNIIDYNINKKPDITDEELFKLAQATDYKNNNVITLPTRSIAVIHKEIIKNKQLQKRFPKTYNFFKQIYNEQNNIKDNTPSPVEGKSMFNARRIGWSRNNRNIVGKLCTPYTAQTTAHHLDAVKEGSIPNVDEFTFNTYKLLSAVGIDYETVIAFIRQPIITKIVNNNNLVNSIFFKSDDNPIDMTIREIAQSINMRIDNKDVDGSTPINEILNSFRKNPAFTQAFDRIFNKDISRIPVTGIFNLKVPLNKQFLFNRIKSEVSQKGYDSMYRAAFDLAMLLTFRNIKKTANVVSDYINATAADKTGAASNLHDVKKLVDKIEDLRSNMTLYREDKSFIDLIYPEGENGFINPEDSEFQSIATIYNYATLMSQKINSQLFITAGAEFETIENQIVKAIGRNLTDEEYKALKKYIISNYYMQSEKLLSPVELDERNRIKWLNTETNELYNREYARIFGYAIDTAGNIQIADVNNPTAKEIEEFAALTPAQKILFIQQNFDEGADVFKALTVTFWNPSDIRSKKLSRQYIGFDDQTDNVEDLLYMYEEGFFNHSPLLKLATIDLIKYAFITEGYDFKTNYISKITPNSVLTTAQEDGGFDIISDLKSGIISYVQNLANNDEFTQQFIRSHSNMLKTNNKLIGWPDESKGEVSVSSNEVKYFNACMQNNGLVHIDATVNSKMAKNIIYDLKLSRNNERYIKVAYSTSENTTQTTVFKVLGQNPYMSKNRFGEPEEVYADYYLIPMNLLDANECVDVSFNAGNNKYNLYQEYINDIKDLNNLYVRYRDLNADPKDIQKYAERDSVRELINQKYVRKAIEQYDPINGKFKSTDAFALTDMVTNAEPKLQGGAKKLVDDINEAYNEDNARLDIITYNLNSELAKIFIPGTDNISEQIIETKDGPKTFIVERLSTPVIANVLALNRRTVQNKWTKKALAEYDDNPMKVSDAIFYSSKAKPDTQEEQAAKVYKAHSELITDDEETISRNENHNINRDPIDNVSRQIMERISFDAIKNKNKKAIEFNRTMNRRGVIISNRTSRQEHRDDIYVAAARYYTAAANTILNRASHFEINGEQFSIDDPELYHKLINNDAYFKELSNLIMDGITFGNRIIDILTLDTSTESKETRDAIKSISNTINKMKQNDMFKKALDHIFNIYMRKYATNPDIINDIINLREAFGDTDAIDAWITDPAEIQNPQVQLVIKKIHGILNKAELFDAKNNERQFREELKDILNMDGAFDRDKVIDSAKGKIRQNFKEEFITERDKVYNEYNEAKILKDKDFTHYKKYIDAKLAYDEFMFKYTNQYLVDDYYKQDIDMRKEVISLAGDAFYRYQMLSSKFYSMKNLDSLTDDEIAERDRIKAEMDDIRSRTYSNGEIKPYAEERAAIFINEYIDKRRKLNKKYFDYQEYEGFQQDYERYSDIIKDFDRENPHMPLERKLANDEYKEAYNWISNNGRVQYSQEVTDKINNAFKVLTSHPGAINNSILKGLRSDPNLLDEFGHLDPTKLSDEQIELLRNEEMNDLAANYDNGYGEALLIKSIPDDIPVLEYPTTPDEETKNIFADIHYKDNALKFRLIGEINEILLKCTDVATGEMNLQLLFNDAIVSNDERNRLADLYENLRSLREGYDWGVIHENDVYKDEIHTAAYEKHKVFMETFLTDPNKKLQFYDIFTILDNAGHTVPNPLIYGYKMPKDEYANTEKTEARKYLKDNIRFVPSDKYIQKRAEMAAMGPAVYNDWLMRNTVYNPYTHRYEPLKIWTKQEAVPGSEAERTIHYNPSFNNQERTAKAAALNAEKYKEYGFNYRTEPIEYIDEETGETKTLARDTKFDSDVKLNAKEQAYKDLLVKTLNKYAVSHQGKKFVNRGYLPRDRKAEIDWKYGIQQGLAMIGYSWHSGADSDNFSEQRDYAHDKEVEMKMLSLLKGKGTRKLKQLPDRNAFASEEEYLKELNQVKEDNKKIIAENEAIDNAQLNRNWDEVIAQFVHNATIVNARENIKPYLYLLLEDLKQNNAYMLDGYWNRRVVKDSYNRDDDDANPRYEQQKQTYELLHNYTRRLLFEEYHKNSVPRTVANLLQNIASAKYMIFNLYGGIANITTGEVNIGMEYAANEYFGKREFGKANWEYMNNIHHIIASMVGDKATSKTVAFMKEFNVVDFDQVLEYGGGDTGIDANLRRVRNWLYGFQSGGEHLMQNSVLLAMLDSHRLYTDNNGIKRIGSLNDYIAGIENDAMMAVIGNNPLLKRFYNRYKTMIQNDLDKKYNIVSGRKDINRGFLQYLRDSNNDEVKGNAKYKELVKAYNQKRNEMIKDAETNFKNANNITVRELFDFKDGHLILKNEYKNRFYTEGVLNNPIGDLETLIGEFKTKVIQTNKKIHGVYDKNGAAQLEKKWYGSLLMQYHKHLYTGIMKRWRRRGYYSEIRGTRERGTYQTLMDFMTMEFDNFDERVTEKAKDSNIVLASIQVAMQSAIRTITQASFRWQSLSKWEQANIRRNIADAAGILSACLLVLAIYAAWDDDEIKDDGFKASCLYLADRLYQESSMYNPIGLISEGKTLWSSPIAGANGPSDLLKACVLIPQALFDPDYNPEYTTGQYAHRNKLEVLLTRNIPGLRVWDRVNNITKHTKYYKIDGTHIGVNVAKTFGKIINEG